MVGITRNIAYNPELSFWRLGLLGLWLNYKVGEVNRILVRWLDNWLCDDLCAETGYEEKEEEGFHVRVLMIMSGFANLSIYSAKVII